VFGVVATHAASTRRQAVARVAQTETLLVSAVDLSASLSDAHATAAFSFLVGGTEPAQSRRLYAMQLRQAAAGLATLAREAGSPAGARAVRRITERLPVYAGLIDDARANNRQGFPVGSAYLRAASKTMRGEMLPAARALYETEARSLTTHYASGTSTATILAVVLSAIALLAVLAATQVFVARKTRRIVNLRLALSSVLALGLATWMLVAFAVQQNALAEAQREGSDPVELLTVTRILASRAQADESIALAARGGGEGEARLADVDRPFQAVTSPIGRSRPGSAHGSGGLLDQAALIAGRSGTAPIDGIYSAYRRYVAAHGRVVREERIGDFTAAVKLAVGAGADPATSTKQAAATLNTDLKREIARAQDRFDEARGRAASALHGLAFGIPLVTALCALLALLGVRQRLEEYR
jgi:hypothetical protein